MTQQNHKTKTTSYETCLKYISDAILDDVSQLPYDMASCRAALIIHSCALVGLESSILHLRACGTKETSVYYYYYYYYQRQRKETSAYLYYQRECASDRLFS